MYSFQLWIFWIILDTLLKVLCFCAGEFNKFTMNNISNTNNHNTSTSYENLNGRLDSNGLLNNFADLNLKQEEDLGNLKLE